MTRRSVWGRWRALFRQPPELEVDDELGFHLEQRAHDYVARGLPPDEARRAAAERFGDVARVRGECATLLRADRSAEARRTLARVSWLDVRLGVRMLAKYPWLSLVSVVGMALAIAVGAGYYGLIGAILDSTLPFDPSGRIVVLRTRDVSPRGGNWAHAASAHDFVAWREGLRSVGDLGAFRDDRRNLIAAAGRTDIVRVAAISAAGFRLAGVAPALGRTLLDADERPGAPPVLVIGHDEWQRRFAGDPAILGRAVRLGETAHTIVGVMPPRFLFPLEHRYWVPLRLGVGELTPEAGAAPVEVFGRLAEGASIAQARAELATVGRRLSAALPATHEHLRPEVLRYTQAFSGVNSAEDELGLRAVQLAIGLLVVIVAVNVASLVYARTATRTGEIAVRTALGASRRRIVLQLLAEALVLSGLAAAVGLALAGGGLRLAERAMRQSLDSDGLAFWIHLGLSPGLVVYAAALAVASGAIIGVVPALKATGKRLGRGLQRFAARGSSLRLGATWTALIVVQVGIAVAALPAALNLVDEAISIGTRRPGVAATDMLRGTLVLTPDAVPLPADSATRAAIGRAAEARFGDRTVELIRRIEAEPGVAAASFVERFPGSGEGWARIEVEGGAAIRDDASDAQGPAGLGGGAAPSMSIAANRMAVDFLDVLGVPVVAGRGFTSADAGDSARAVLVDRALAQRIGGGANVVGRRVRYTVPDDWTGPPNPWHEIVGVVPEFTREVATPNGAAPLRPRMYHALAPGRAPSVALVVRVDRGASAAFLPRLRDLAASVDPELRIERLVTVMQAWRSEQRAFRYMASAILAVAASVVLLSAAGIYAMMSFTVARRRREIAIRAALGADARRVLGGIFARAAGQLAAGAGVGLAVAAAVEWLGPGGTLGRRGPVLLPAVAALMLTVGLLAALGPARRGLAVEPTEAMREE